MDRNFLSIFRSNVYIAVTRGCVYIARQWQFGEPVREARSMFAAMKIRKGKRNIIIANIFISNFSILYSILKRLNSNRSREINKWNVFDMQNDLSWSNGRSNKK